MMTPLGRRLDRLEGRTPSVSPLESLTNAELRLLAAWCDDNTAPMSPRIGSAVAQWKQERDARL